MGIAQRRPVLTPLSEASRPAVLGCSPNRYYDLIASNAEVDETVTLEQVLLIRDSSGTKPRPSPMWRAPRSPSRWCRIARGPRSIVYKMRPPKKTRRNEKAATGQDSPGDGSESINRGRANRSS